MRWEESGLYKEREAYDPWESISKSTLTAKRAYSLLKAKAWNLIFQFLMAFQFQLAFKSYRFRHWQNIYCHWNFGLCIILMDKCTAVPYITWEQLNQMKTKSWSYNLYLNKIKNKLNWVNCSYIQLCYYSTNLHTYRQIDTYHFLYDDIPIKFPCSCNQQFNIAFCSKWPWDLSSIKIM